MSRPRKWRSVCSLPQNSRFGPLDGCLAPNQPVYMSVDEYEAMRLIDHEDMTQQECAELMGVARTTIQGIYDSAREKLAISLVEGRILSIEGGEYRLCEHAGQYGRGCGQGCRWRHVSGHEGETQT
ncbi:MAG: DUF134 domain-containing protein [Sphaerochaetaceae bacterium]